MKRIAMAVTLLGAAALAWAQSAGAAEAEKQADVNLPADRVVVMYFHRTQRCPTCLRMGSYSEEAVVKGYPKEIKDRTIEFHYVDFQDAKNAALTKGYKITGPALVVVKVVNNKPAEVRNLEEIWTKNRDKDVFFKYVRDNVTACQQTQVGSRAEVVRTHNRTPSPACGRGRGESRFLRAS